MVVFVLMYFVFCVLVYNYCFIFKKSNEKLWNEKILEWIEILVEILVKGNLLEFELNCSLVLKGNFKYID